MTNFTLRNRSIGYSFIVITAFFGLFLMNSAWATESGPAPLSLQQAIKTALEQNAAIAAVESARVAATERVTQARSGFLPQIDFIEHYNYTTNPMWAFGTKLNQEIITQADFNPDILNDPDAIGNFSSKFAVTWPIYDSGQSLHGTRQAKMGVGVADLDITQTRQQIIAQTAKVYLGLLLANEQLAVIEKTIETAKAHHKIVADRFNSGLVVKSDLLRNQVHIAELEQQLLQTESDVQIAQSMLNAVMGAAEQTVYQLQTPLTRGKAVEKSMREWVATALEKRPDYRQLQLRLDIAQEQIGKAKSAHMPSVHLLGNYETNTERFEDVGHNYTVGVMVNVNLFSGNRISAGKREAEAGLMAVKAQLKRLKDQLQVETQKAFLQAQNAWRRIDVSDGARKQAEENLRIVRSRYQNGLFTIVELLDAEVTFQQAQTHYLQAIHDHTLAVYQLGLAAGVLDKNFP